MHPRNGFLYLLAGGIKNSFSAVGAAFGQLTLPVRDGFLYSGLIRSSTKGPTPMVSGQGPITKSDRAGITFTLSTAGAASRILRYRASGKAEELTLGRYLDLTLSAARKLAAEKNASKFNVARFPLRDTLRLPLLRRVRVSLFIADRRAWWRRPLR